MANLQLSVKNIKISQHQRVTLIATGLAVAVFVFATIFSLKLYAKMQFQKSVLNALRDTNQAIERTSKNLDSLDASLDSFNKQGNLLKSQPTDVTNAGIVLRALPKAYNYNQMTANWDHFKATRLSKDNDGGYVLGKASTFSIQGLVGGEAVVEPVPVEDGQPAPAVTVQPQPVELTFTAHLDNEGDINKLLKDLDNFIQPVQIQGIQVTYPSSADDGAALGSYVVVLSIETYIQQGVSVQFPQSTIQRQKASPTEEEGEQPETNGETPEGE